MLIAALLGYGFGEAGAAVLGEVAGVPGTAAGVFGAAAAPNGVLGVTALRNILSDGCGVRRIGPPRPPNRPKELVIQFRVYGARDRFDRLFHILLVQIADDFTFHRLDRNGIAAAQLVDIKLKAHFWVVGSLHRA